MKQLPFLKWQLFFCNSNEPLEPDAVPYVIIFLRTFPKSCRVGKQEAL